jgi:hypothetical protein
METVLSDGAKGLDDRGTAGGVGPRPFPLPRIRPPPSMRDMATVCVVDQAKSSCNREETDKSTDGNPERQDDQKRPIRASSCIAEGVEQRQGEAACRLRGGCGLVCGTVASLSRQPQMAPRQPANDSMASARWPLLQGVWLA